MVKRAILLDYGGVVADHYCEPATTELAELLGVGSGDVESLVSERTPHGAAYRLNSITPEEFWLTIAEKRHAGACAFDWRRAQLLWAETYVVNPLVLDLMKHLKTRRGWMVGVLSNMDRLRHAYVMRLLNWSEYCDVFVNSWQLGAMKPDLRAYEHSLEMLGFEKDPGHVLYVDDRSEHVRAAVLAGCQGCVFESLDALLRVTMEE